jgi:hypothetical protein
MPYEFSFSERDRIVTVRVSGEVGHDEHCLVLNKAIDLCQKTHCSSVLVDLRELSTKLSSTMDCFEFGESLAKEALAVRFAYVVPRDPKSQEDAKFTTTVGVNRGIVCGEFETIEEANKWLLEKK